MRPLALKAECCPGFLSPQQREQCLPRGTVQSYVCVHARCPVPRVLCHPRARQPRDECAAPPQPALLPQVVRDVAQVRLHHCGM